MMNSSPAVPDAPVFRVLAVTQGQWGERIADNVHQHRPSSWTVDHWKAPRVLPPVVDDPDDFLPPSFKPANLILALGETAGLYQLIPDIARLTGARAVLAPIDRNESLPPGLAAQLKVWLADLGVALVCPKPFCSLTPTTYNRPPIQAAYDVPAVAAFAAHFGRPQFRIEANAEGEIVAVDIEREAACGCARAVAEGLVGCPLSEAEYQAGMLHHHFPCLASMNQDDDYSDTLMHVSGHILREAVQEQIRDRLEPPPYWRPMGFVE
jgi:hypothetical protein